MFNINEILDNVYKLDGLNKTDEAIDIIIEFFWDSGAEQNFAAMDEFYDKIDVSKITDGAILCCPVMNTFKYIPQVLGHLPYCMKAIARYKELGYSDDRIHRIMDRYLEVGNYWENMAALGAPEWLAGKKPQ